MMFQERRIIDEMLGAEEPCLGAVFCSYTFDPAYFEEHVLRSLLRLRGDPEQDPARYHEEARCALRDTPIACFVDASVRRAGRRLPYDLHLVRKRTFHPKVTLVLYESEARLAVGSGNVTKSGLEQNTELFFVRSLRYDRPSEAAVLRTIDGFLGESAALLGTAAPQLSLVREALSRRVHSTRPPESNELHEFEFVSSYRGRLLDQLGQAIARECTITRVGILSPFFEQDDLQAGSEGGLDAVLAEIVALRPSRGAILDVGLPWDDAPVVAPASAPLPSLDDGAGSLWAWRKTAETGGEEAERMEYFVVEGTEPKKVRVRDAVGRACLLDRADFEVGISERRAWRVERPMVHAPHTILQQIAATHDVRLWLHPTTQISSTGRSRRRPLHSKVILVTTRHRGKVYTYALTGSANASRSALARSVAQGGNVEAGILCRFDGEVFLHQLLPSLVNHSLDGVDLLEREMPASIIDLSAWIDEAVHDPTARTLRISWNDHGPPHLGEWSLRYLDREIAQGEGVAVDATESTEFDLDPASAELTFVSGGHEWQVPIRVSDLAALPTSANLASLGLRELLAMLGRRMDSEQLMTLRSSRGTSGLSDVLDSMFGEHFGPTDVFRAWWGGVEDLRRAPTVAAFRHRLIGPTGMLTAWRCLRDTPEDVLSRDEAWVYGCELLRESRGIEFPEGPDAGMKRAMLDAELEALASELEGFAPDVTRHPWVEEVRRFYGLGGCNARS